MRWGAPTTCTTAAAAGQHQPQADAVAARPAGTQSTIPAAARLCTRLYHDGHTDVSATLGTTSATTAAAAATVPAAVSKADGGCWWCNLARCVHTQQHHGPLWGLVTPTAAGTGSSTNCSRTAATAPATRSHGGGWWQQQPHQQPATVCCSQHPKPRAMPPLRCCSRGGVVRCCCCSWRSRWWWS